MSHAAARLLHAEVAKRDGVETELIDIASVSLRTDDAGEAIKDNVASPIKWTDLTDW